MTLFEITIADGGLQSRVSGTRSTTGRTRRNSVDGREVPVERYLALVAIRSGRCPVNVALVLRS
jgi:hypothetical protein